MLLRPLARFFALSRGRVRCGPGPSPAMSAARTAPDPDGEAEVDLGRYGRALLARWWLLLAGLVVGRRRRLPHDPRRHAVLPRAGGPPTSASRSAPARPRCISEHEPSTARAIVTSGVGDQAAWRRRRYAPGKDSLGLPSPPSRAAFRGRGQTPLIQVTVEESVTGRGRSHGERFWRPVLAFQLSSGARQKCRVQAGVGLRRRRDQAVNEALSRSDLSTTEKILLQGRLQTLPSDKTLNAQLLYRGEDGRGCTGDHARRRRRSQSARNHRNSTAVGALIGLISAASRRCSGSP